MSGDELPGGPGEGTRPFTPLTLALRRLEDAALVDAHVNLQDQDARTNVYTLRL